jgi:hypothetical protein
MTEFNADAEGRGLVDRTYLGGAGNDAGLGDFGTGTALDGDGNVYVTGYTYSGYDGGTFLLVTGGHLSDRQ